MVFWVRKPTFRRNISVQRSCLQSTETLHSVLWYYELWRRIVLWVLPMFWRNISPPLTAIKTSNLMRLNSDFERKHASQIRPKPSCIMMLFTRTIELNYVTQSLAKWLNPRCSRKTVIFSVKKPAVSPVECLILVQLLWGDEGGWWVQHSIHRAGNSRNTCGYAEGQRPTLMQYTQT